MDAIGNFVSPKPSKPPTDPTSLSTDSKPSPELYVAFARLHHQNNRLAEASVQYEKALDLDSNHMTALLGYARVNEDMGKHEEAMNLYRKATRVHPRKAPVFNNLALSCAKRGLRDEALGAMGRAVELDPTNVKYRNNMASLLVDAERNRDAYTHLRAVHDHATCLYNLGYLLKQRGKSPEAIQHFTAALQSNPSFAPARRELQELTAVAQGEPARRQPVERAVSRPAGQANMQIRNDAARITLRDPRTENTARTNPQPSPEQAQRREMPPWPSDLSAGRSPERARVDRAAPTDGPWHRQLSPAYGSRSQPAESAPAAPVLVAPADPNRPKRLPPVAPIRGTITDIAPMPGAASTPEENPQSPVAPLPPARYAPRPY